MHDSSVASLAYLRLDIAYLRVETLRKFVNCLMPQKYHIPIFIYLIFAKNIFYTKMNSSGAYNYFTVSMLRNRHLKKTKPKWIHSGILYFKLNILKQIILRIIPSLFLSIFILFYACFYHIVFNRSTIAYFRDRYLNVLTIVANIDGTDARRQSCTLDSVC